jgi:hypothetical protein
MQTQIDTGTYQTYDESEARHTAAAKLLITIDLQCRCSRHGHMGSVHSGGRGGVYCQALHRSLVETRG